MQGASESQVRGSPSVRRQVNGFVLSSHCERAEHYNGVFRHGSDYRPGEEQGQPGMHSNSPEDPLNGRSKKGSISRKVLNFAI